MTHRTIYTTLIAWLSCLVPVFASGEAGGEGLPLNAVPLFESFPYITNSMLMVWISVAIITLFCRAATKKMSLVPSRIQNFAEWVVESLYDFLSSILGPYLVKKTFWFFASVFLLILVTNWLGLIPGVGTIGRIENGHIVGMFRGGNADLNMTMAMSLSFAVLWFYWAISENGVVGFLKHIFAPKGEFNGVMMVFMVPLFLIVGLLEVISIAIRPVALTFRLFGNIYGGEQTMEELMKLVPNKWLAFLPSLPFCFMELMVGFIQALVFMLLTAVFLRLICEHAGEEGAHH
jgi:F-type H+-transporting ATPase subunit a